MKTFTVSRVDYVKKTRVPIGRVQERRRKDRSANLLGLLRLARKTYGTDPEDSDHIDVDSREASEPGWSIWWDNETARRRGEEYSSED